MQPKPQNLEKQPSESASRADENPPTVEVIVEQQAAKTKEAAIKEKKKQLRTEEKPDENK